MKFLSIEPFIPSGPDFEGSKQLFLELGFHINWDQGNFIGFQADECRFVLQKYNEPGFIQHYMLGMKVSNVTDFRNDILAKKLPEKYGIRIGEITQQPYGKEMTLIDIAGVLWHFIQH
jgi:hypothetical protein